MADRARHILALAALALATPALADPGPSIRAAFDRFASVCPAALIDPETYIASLTLPGPAGEDVLYRSPDGKYLLVHTAQSEGVTDYVELTTLSDRTRRTCAIHATLPDFPEAPEVADILYPILQRTAAEVIGGRIPIVTPMWDPGESPEAFHSGDWYVFHMTGLWPDLDAIATAQAEYGAVSFYVSSEGGQP
ncbi:hypothetical protein RXV90_14525 [Rhodophyticola sp. MJ-SS7]|nr:hypothetical protein [Rhodophyticola sp. MJ-SS7]